ncbi:unnamed protein product [Ilex paraguariensis]|uniref:Uncharacterized protein n=1 Tax=Ilex paraguariensis TaxID=185542 RepID=A0ABC8V2D3_9AQUA
MSLKLVINTKGRRVLLAETGKDFVDSFLTFSLCLLELFVDYVKEMAYMVTDDLVVEPVSIISSLTLLNRIKAMDADFIEEKMVTLSAYEFAQLFLPYKNDLVALDIGPWS